MKTYKVTQVVEMMVTHKIRAANADAANHEAGERTHRACAALLRYRKNLNFGDINDDYLPARDEEGC